MDEFEFVNNEPCFEAISYQPPSRPPRKIERGFIGAIRQSFV